MRDVNAVAAGLLRDLAFAQDSEAKMFGYKRAAAVVFALEQPLDELADAQGILPRIAGIGPASTRVLRDVIATGASSFVDEAVHTSPKRTDIERRRGLRDYVLSRAAVRRVLEAPPEKSVTLRGYRGDLQMHSEWSDGAPSLDEIVDAWIGRGYQFAAVTDHSYGLKIAGGMSMAEAAQQWREVDRINEKQGNRFRLIRGVEANIAADGALDLSPEEAGQFELVLAAPHSKLRRTEDQTSRLINAVRNPRVQVLAHPRGRIAGSRAGVVADWQQVFRAAANEEVAVEIDGDPARQDLDYALAAQALAEGCLFALDSDAHAVTQLNYAETAIAHAKLAGIPPERVINFWPVDQLLDWLGRKSLSTTGAVALGGRHGRN